MGQDYLKIKLVINETNIPMVSRFVGDAVEPIGLTPRQAKLLCFAVETILELRMGHLPKEMPHVEIVVTKNLEDISVSVRDKGLPYVLTDRQRQIIANGLADNYRLDQLGSDGQRLTYILKTERSQELSIPEMKDEELLDDTLTVSPVRTDDEDINEAIRCLYAAYGYEYLHQALYQVEHFREVLLDGSFVASMARNEHGQVLAMGALVRDADFPGLYEASALATKPFARGKGVANLLVKNLLERLNDLDAEGCYVCPVAFHTATQKICSASGMTPTGFVLHGFPPTSVGSFRDGDRRMDYALCVSLRNREKEHILYLPEEAKDITAEVFETEHLNYTAAQADTLPAETSVSFAVDAFTATSYITVDAAAADFGERMDTILSDKDVSHCEVLVLFLNMNQSGAPEAYTLMRERGFLFMGSLPGSTNGDYLVLEHLMGIPFERDKIKVTPEYGALLDRLLEINQYKPE